MRKKPVKEYDRDVYQPVILASICTGEQTAGFQNIHTGQFHGECLISKERDLRNFQKQYGITGEIKKIY